jgi:hypothetical protein
VVLLGEPCLELVDARIIRGCGRVGAFHTPITMPRIRLAMAPRGQFRYRDDPIS